MENSILHIQMSSQHSTDVFMHHRSVITHNTTRTQIRLTQNYGSFATYERNKMRIAIDFATHCKNADGVLNALHAMCEYVVSTRSFAQ